VVAYASACRVGFRADFGGPDINVATNGDAARVDACATRESRVMKRDEPTLWLPGVEWAPSGGAATAREPSDAKQRRRALDPESSFIVQAPAGSGKTELLIQRFLALLARVDQPESIVAITFTVKAAGEMRSRVLEALRKAHNGVEPESAHERLTSELAAAALARDGKTGWDLLHNPDRLRIQTIDALCMAITRQMPWLARFGAMPGVTEDAREMYRTAARMTLELLGRADENGAAVRTLVAHLDNNLTGATDLLAGMLETRDHWLRLMGVGADLIAVRTQLEAALQHVVCELLAQLRAAVPAERKGELVEFARYAGANVNEGEVARCASLAAIPGCDIADLNEWTAIASLLLTGKGEWRKKADRRIGFPPSNKRIKDRFERFLREMERHEALRELLAGVSDLPACRYSEEQWQVLAALFRLLPLTVAHLRLVFAQSGVVDFVEIAGAARLALGKQNEPTDLALSMGSRVEHLLVDEFQDTSVTQFELLNALTAGWEDNGRRTLFLVGDPMQSIYRFRQAEVGLFLNVQRTGLGSFCPEPLGLAVNFRSAAKIVEWVNETFRGMFPPSADPHTGRVTYADSSAFRGGSADAGVTVHPFIGRNDEDEAELVADLIAQELRDGAADDRIAVLVRSRAHLAAIADRLRDRGQRFRAIEIQALAERPVIQDLIALTRALLHLGDRTAWLSILRAPWCGLTLRDLHAIAGRDLKAAIWDQLRSHDTTLSEDGARRVFRIMPALARALEQRGRVPVVKVVEQIWTDLSGPGLVAPHDFADARAFFDMLDGAGATGDIVDFDELSRRIEDLFANPDATPDIPVELMTIHRAKGLEFDTVILPGLGRRPRGDDPSLLLWTERPVGGTAELLMAPIAAAGDDEDRTYRFIRREEAEKTRNEAQRLLYVACSRAKRRLHLIGHAEPEDDGLEARLAEPVRDSLLAHLWPALGPEFEKRLAAMGTQAALVEKPQRAPRVLNRIVVTSRIAPVRTAEPEARNTAPLSDGHESHRERRIGTLIHRMLEQIARGELEAWTPARVRSLIPAFENTLAEDSVTDPGAADLVAEALERTLADERGRWILSPHEEAASEYAVTSLIDGQIRHISLDRTFVENGVRWIIDYKTGGAEEEQLERYATVLRALDARPIRVGFYFPLTGRWVEWSAG
jgi:ATP-dependent exoDNAse (exonuclease V) beta subunit